MQVISVYLRSRYFSPRIVSQLVTVTVAVAVAVTVTVTVAVTLTVTFACEYYTVTAVTAIVIIFS